MFKSGPRSRQGSGRSVCRRHTVLVLFAAILFSSCSSTIPEPRYNAAPVKIEVPVIPVRKYLPDGWADISSRSKQPQIKLWIINRDFSATMVLKELQSDKNTRQSLMNEEMNLIATVSLRSKIPDNNADVRVTRVPSVIDLKRNFSSYAYIEKGLLRRVVVFKKEDKLMELELFQEQASAEFDALTNDLVTLATTLYER